MTRTLRSLIVAAPDTQDVDCSARIAPVAPLRPRDEGAPSSHPRFCRQPPPQSAASPRFGVPPHWRLQQNADTLDSHTLRLGRLMDEITIAPNVTFRATRGTHNAGSLVDEISRAQRVLIVTYNISVSSRTLLDQIAKTDSKAEVSVVLNVPGRFDSYFSMAARTQARNRINATVALLSTLPAHVNRYFLFSNHMKIIACDGLVYVGSANFSDESMHNHEAGIIIADDKVAKSIVDAVWNRILPDLVPLPGGDEIEWLKTFLYGFSEVPLGKVQVSGIQVDGMVNVLDYAERLCDPSKPLPKWLPNALRTAMARLIEPELVDPDISTGVAGYVLTFVDKTKAQELSCKLQTNPSDEVTREAMTFLYEQFHTLCKSAEQWAYPVVDNT